MTILDANVLLLAYNANAAGHEKARQWLESLFATSDWVGLPWLTIWAFVRISTNARLFPKPLTAADAFGIVRTWLALPKVLVVDAGSRHLDLLEQLATGSQAAGPLLTDAALAAIAIEHGALLASTDRDFSRFPGLQWVDPLQESGR